MTRFFQNPTGIAGRYRSEKESLAATETDVVEIDAFPAVSLNMLLMRGIYSPGPGRRSEGGQVPGRWAANLWHGAQGAMRP